MKRIKLVVLFGTRPEAIKLAPVVLELKRRPELFETVLVFSGQHREMGLSTLTSFGLTPDVELETMVPGQTLNQLASRLFGELDGLLKTVKPDWILVQGDTTTAMAGAQAAFFAQVRVGHVEAGLRTNDRFSPFPEEVNRQVVGRVADLHFAPTERAANTLRTEGIPPESVLVTGNTVVDALLWMRKALPEDPPPSLGNSIAAGRRVVLVTCHRRESFGAPLEQVCKAVAHLAERFPDVLFLFPVHPNPAARETVKSILDEVSGIRLIEPLDYPDLLWCINRSLLILSDSGGIQEEAPSFGKPLLILREKTERPEVVEVGAGFLVGTDQNRIIAEASRFLDETADHNEFANILNPFGDGNASARIAEGILDYCQSFSR